MAALAGALLAYKNLPPWLQVAPSWQRIGVIAIFPALALAFQTIPAAIEQRRKRRSIEIAGSARGGYFRLGPRDDETSFTRADGLHDEVLNWLEQRSDPVVFLTGMSGSGKSSLLNAWVVPHLLRRGTTLIRLRGYQDLGAALAWELQKPGQIWQKGLARSTDLWSLLERASRFIRPGKLLVIIDQFEEFVILEDLGRKERFDSLFSSLREQPIPGVSFLIVFRSDYIGLVEKLALPPLLQGSTWREVPPFTENAAREFIKDCGLVVEPELLRGVLREATELEQVRGLIRPVTINLCGLVMARFSSGLPRGFRPGNLVRGFLQESISLPAVREVAPKLLPHMISNHVTKQPRTVERMAKITGLSATDIRGCLRVLGQTDRAIVRPLDENQLTWEISHDFLVPMLDSILARLSVSFWRRLRPWLPWISTGVLGILTIVSAGWQTNPATELSDLGWHVQQDSVGPLRLEAYPALLAHSIGALKRVKRPITLTLREVKSVDLDISQLGTLKNLTALDLSFTPVRDISSLQDLRGLTSLDFAGTNVSDLSSLKHLKGLTSLDLSGTSVSDLSPLKDLKSLTSLNLTFTPVSDLSPLTDLRSLTTLNFRSTQVTDLSPLRNLSNLTSLDLTSVDVSDLTPVQNLKRLNTLSLSGTKVNDLTPLKNLNSLSTLVLSGTKVSDLSALKDLKSLISLGLSRTRVSNPFPLKELKSLTSLDLSSTSVDDVSQLRDLKNLNSLDISGTKVRDLTPLKDLSSLTSLNIANTPVSDASPLKGLKSLTSLDLRFTKVADTSALLERSNLQILR